MDEQHRTNLFDNWANSYDESVQSEEQFPFAGYDAVLDRILQDASPMTGMKVLDIGIGTGNLSERFLAHDCELWGVDFSEQMLSIAKDKFPHAHLVQADLLAGVHPELPADFPRIVSAYVFHEFKLEKKVQLIDSLAKYNLTENGCFIVGDISFNTAYDREKAHKRWQDKWDRTEHYWAADEAYRAFRDAGFAIEYQQVSICGGVYRIYPIRR
jgi:putative AdoMet-dependent methyltransferase